MIEGYLTRVERSGRVTGSPEIGFEFDTIRLRNSGTYDFSGYIEQVRTPNGDKVKVDNEGSVKEKNGQTERTVLRGGIGAAIGAIIGGIAGGGKGAAIGAAVGAGAGAGSVIVQGRDDLQLDNGTEFTIHTTQQHSNQLQHFHSIVNRGQRVVLCYLGTTQSPQTSPLPTLLALTHIIPRR